ncbi:hypothetical protein DIS24_g2176 [Lasiodiplodia hormozganensis]|nr:hypothetical protein DIS24_g2176 [Lasiodiplodia hormozganensis]
MSVQAYKAFVFFQVSYCCSIILIKASIALMLTRIICGQYMILWTLRITIALFSSITLSVAIYCLLQCRPLAKTWNPAIEGYCHPSNVLASLSMTVTVSSIISDVIICLSPIPLLWNIQMNRNLKLVSGFLLSLGFFASICAIIRLAYTLALNSTEDYLFHVYGVTVWCFAEVGVALTVGCSSTLRPMFRTCLGGTGESKKESNDTSRGTYELRTGANDGVIRSQNDDGQITRVATEPSVGDDESARKMLGPSEIRVTHRFDVREEV